MTEIYEHIMISQCFKEAEEKNKAIWKLRHIEINTEENKHYSC